MKCRFCKYLSPIILCICKCIQGLLEYLMMGLHFNPLFNGKNDPCWASNSINDDKSTTTHLGKLKKLNGKKQPTTLQNMVGKTIMDAIAITCTW